MTGPDDMDLIQFGIEKEVLYPPFRNYDIEWEFIKQMDYFNDIKITSPMVAYGECAYLIGFLMDPPTCEANENKAPCET
jgi:hypothetical protein